MTVLEDLVRDYRTILLRYLSRRDETVLAEGYGLGRRALAGGVSVIDLVHIHHRVVAELAETDLAGTSDTTLAASELLVETLASYEMTRPPVGSAGDGVAGPVGPVPPREAGR
ncbi:phosphatase RsbU N-terminal domain-containing protein [Oryzobacter sp. R7]|uniref:phosphatase RsbU N-terminal domain-containing protein n=1 Tax=Oryzobacter faecalis TaxID=3388656 RepID=UPI00398CB605